ncbi:MAG: preprotein translocase subunit SecY [Mycobacteriales bacterium]
MLGAFVRAFRTPDLRRKLLFTLGIIALFRLGSALPSPDVNYTAIHTCLSAVGSQGIYNLVNLFSGGALLQLSIFALGIMPYITSSIIVQLLIVVIPRLERLKEQGQSGQTKLTQYTRYLTIGLAVLQSTGIAALARGVPSQLFPSCNQSILESTSVFRISVLVLTMTAGTGVIMWLGELITDRGIGNGMSLLIFTQIAARFPQQGGTILSAKGGVVLTIVIVIGVLIVAAIVFVEQAQRRIPVQYAKRMIGRRMYGGTSTYIPMKVNQAGVIPVIFAASLLYLPTLLAKIWTSNKAFTSFVNTYLVQQNSALYMAAYFLLIIFFTYFYVAITFNPTEVADNMKKYGGFIPGIRPGRPTAEYLDFVLSRITLPGSLYLAIIAILPIITIGFFGPSANGQPIFPFGGTSILILVGVGLDTAKQIESQLMLRNYEGFLR